MANPNFVPSMSTNDIWRDLDDTRCLTDDLDQIESDISDLESGKAESNHTHDGYAPSSHEHSGYASSGHGHSYNDLSDKPTIPSAYTHPESHPASMITGLSTVATSGSYNDLSNKPTIPSAYTHPTSHPASMITGLATVATSGNYSDLNGTPTIPTIPASLPANGGNADTVDGKHADDFATANHTHSAYANATHSHTANQIGYNGLSVGTFTKASGASSLDLEIRYNDYKAVLYGTFVVAEDLAVATSVTIAKNITAAACPGVQFESCIAYFGNRPLSVRVTSGCELQVRNCGASALPAGSSITFRISYPIF